MDLEFTGAHLRIEVSERFQLSDFRDTPDAGKIMRNEKFIQKLNRSIELRWVIVFKLP